MEKQLLSIPEFCEVTGIGETLTKRLIRERRILSVRVGDRRLIPAQAVREYVGQLMAEAAADRELATA
jgi:excisionase family DNA binding protein